MRNESPIWKAVAVATLVSLTACAAPSPPTPPLVADPVKLTPLPLSVRTIDSQPSASYLTKVSNWLSKVGSLSSDETPK